MQIIAPRRSSVLPLVVTAVLCLAFAGVAHALSVDIVTPKTDPAEVYQQVRTPFWAVAYDDKGNDVSDLATFTWSFPEAKEPVVGNPVLYRFPATGKFTVSVTATLEKDAGSDKITVVVTPLEIAASKESLQEDFTFTARTGDHVFGDTVCDDVELVIQQIPENVLPFEWVVARFERFQDGQWVTQHTQRPDWDPELGFYASYVWTSTFDRNEPALWRAHIELDEVGAEPPNTEVIEIERTWTPDNTVVKATGPELILHHADDTSHTIGWDISHYAALNPTFTVTVKIYDLQGNLVTTLMKEGVSVGEDSIDWDTDLPEQAGIYTYTIHASHGSDPPPPHPCEDQDKSAFLEISDVYFDWAFEPRSLRLYGDVHYTLSRDASEVSLVVYDPGLTIAYGPAVLPSLAGEQSYHFDFTVAGNPMNQFYFVLRAGETKADGKLNRDGKSKPALPKGGVLVLAVLAYNFRGALYPSANQVLLQAEYQQEHGPEGELYPLPPYMADVHLQNWDVKRTYERLAEYDTNGRPNPLADALVFYLGHGAPGVMLIGDPDPNGYKEIWTGEGEDRDLQECFYMGNERFGADALRRCLVAVIASCESADPGPGIPSVMQAFVDHGARCAIGYHGWLDEDVARVFANTFWQEACAQADQDGTTIQEAFIRARYASGSPYWTYVGNADETVRPAKYQGDGEP